MKTGHLPGLEVLLKKHEALFSDELGMVSAHRATLHLRQAQFQSFSRQDLFLLLSETQLDNSSTG